MNKDSLQGHRKRLRDRFVKGGLGGFHDYEILELVLSYCIPRKNVKPIAKELISRFKKVGTVLNAPVDKLKETEGVGEYSAFFLNLIHSVGVECLKENIMGKIYLTSYSEIISFCQKSIGGLRHEVFQVIFLTVSGELIAVENIHEGSLTQAVVYPRKVFERAFYHNAATLVLAHNHPGGNLVPSSFDLEITKKIQKAGEYLDISIFDHIIVTDEGYLSFADSGLL